MEWTPSIGTDVPSALDIGQLDRAQDEQSKNQARCLIDYRTLLTPLCLNVELTIYDLHSKKPATSGQEKHDTRRITDRIENSVTQM